MSSVEIGPPVDVSEGTAGFVLSERDGVLVFHPVRETSDRPVESTAGNVASADEWDVGVLDFA